MKIKVLVGSLKGQIVDVWYAAPNGKMVIKQTMGLLVLMPGEYEIIP